MLASRLRGIRFAPDEWMDGLSIDVYDEEKDEKIETLQWKLGQELLARGLTVIIEWGLGGGPSGDVLRLGARAWWILNRRLGSGPFTDHFKRGMLSTETDYQQACERRKAIFEVLDGFFRKFDFWILPVAPSSAILRSMCGRRIKTPNGLIEYSRYVGSYIVPATTLGTPVLTYPIGFDDARMPVAVQIHGPRFSDRWLVKGAARLEQ